MLTKYRLATFALALIAAPSIVQANNFSYNYFETRVGTSPQSFGGEVSMLITQNAHVIAKLDSQMKGDWDIATGVGFNGPLSEFIDIYGELLLRHSALPDEDNVANHTGAELNAGLRTWISEQTELHSKVGRYNDKSIAGVGVSFHSTDQLSIGADILNNGRWGPQILMSVRFNY
jgi:hypothetical protein